MTKITDSEKKQLVDRQFRAMVWNRHRNRGEDIDIAEAGKGEDDIAEAGKGEDDIAEAGKGDDDIAEAGTCQFRLYV